MKRSRVFVAEPRRQEEYDRHNHVNRYDRRKVRERYTVLDDAIGQDAGNPD
jgi:hypothetical protein